MGKRIDWSQLQHALGPATLVPKQVKDLIGRNPLARAESLTLLRTTVVGDSTWFDCSGPLVTMLLGSLGKADEPDVVLALVADVVGADHRRAWLDPRPDPAGHEGEARGAAMAQAKRLLALATDKRANVRAAVDLVLATLPELRDDSVPVLIERAGSDRVPSARASAFLALAALAEGHEGARGAIRDGVGEGGLVGGAASLATLRVDESATFADHRAGLAEWLSWKGDDGPPFWWFRTLRPFAWFPPLRHPDQTGRGLVALARHLKRADDLTEVASSMVAEADAVLQLQLTKVLLGLGGLAPVEGRPPPAIGSADDLSAEQRAMAERLADTWLLPAGGYRLPAAKRTRRRWVGLEEPGPLEQPIDVGGETMARWQVLKTGNVEALEGLTPLERWQAWIEYSARSYPPYTWNMQPDAIEAELERVAGEADLHERATELADELSQRFRAADQARQLAAVEPVTAALLLLPLVRAGKPLEPSWLRLVPVRPEPHAREILQALDEQTREERVYDHLRDDPNSWSAVQNVLAVGDLVFSDRLAALLTEKLGELDRSGQLLPHQIADMRKRLAELTGS